MEGNKGCVKENPSFAQISSRGEKNFDVGSDEGESLKRDFLSVVSSKSFFGLPLL